ncbi:hypothetical protein MTIM_52250 [Mycobacterium timonense]|uniref:Uncharacterized protein n=1 Tax=Mycobacterium timonense TaxID=701043 RepID=A0A7I9ZF85_9MYCO|nr:hypothetical protein MTIM_52250 [Mycobacterium timonense]
MQWNRLHLAHAQLTVAGLLESVINAAKGLKLAKLEGDAAFFWAPDTNAKVVVCERLSRMRTSFLERRERMKTTSPASARVANSSTSCRSNSSCTWARWRIRR